MNKISTAIMATTAGVMLAATIASPVYAWHPEGTIVKQVTNVTAGGTMQDANTATTAVAVKPGDTLKYTITITNPAKAADKHYNDLAFLKLTDNLPAGVELVKDPSLRNLSEDLANLLPGDSITKEVTVKVTATTDMTIENKACFSGDSVVKDAPRSGCDVAIVKVTVPKAPVTPVTPPAPVTPVTPPTGGTGSTTPTPAPVADKPAELPQTGPASVLLIAGLVSLAGYAGNMLRLRYSRQQA